MASLYEQIVRDIDDEEMKKEIISSLTFFGGKITKQNVKELREKINKKFKGKNVPIKLSEQQIEEIVEFSIPKIPAVLNIISEDNNRQIKEFIKSELRERKIVVTTDNIEKLKNEIKETYYRSVVSPGDSVGVEVAMSFGQPLTQMNLDTFHSAGTSSDLGSGVKSLQELFNVSSTRKKNLTTIHFKDKNLTREEVMIQGKGLKGVCITTLLESSEIKYVEDRESLDLLDGEDSSWWYDNYLTLFPPETELKEVVLDVENLTEYMVDHLKRYHNSDIGKSEYINNNGFLCIIFNPLIASPESISNEIENSRVLYVRPYLKVDRFLRLKLNVVKCYNLGISMNDIVSSLNDETIICIASPLSVGIVDIHPNEEYVQETVNKFITKGGINLAGCKKKTSKINIPVALDETNLLQSKILFLTVIIENCLNDIFIKGIKGINNIIPISENVINSLKTKRVNDIDILLKYNKRNLWFLSINYMKLKYTGIPHEKITNLCNDADIEIVDNKIFNDNGEFSKHPHLIVESEKDPKDVISTKYNEADKYVKQQVKLIVNSKSELNYNLPDYPNIYRNASYNYAYAEGEKIVRKLMRHTKLDNKLILPNNPNEICDIFGIESARLYMVREYVHLIESSDSYVTPVNIELLVDYQTSMGFLTAITAIGSSKQGTSSLSAATFNDPIGAFQKAASIGKTDKINSISSCIMSGKKSLNGSGLSSVVYEDTPEKLFDEMPRDFNKNEEFCDNKYVVFDEKEPNPVDINIEDLMNNQRPEDNKFSTENIPTIVPSMEPPEFLDDRPETPEMPDIQNIIEENMEPERLVPIAVDDDDSDFDIPDATDDIGELKDF